MMDRVLIDTCIWSEIFRRKNPDDVIQETMKQLLMDLRTVLIGPIRQELLSGIKDEKKFCELKEVMSVLSDEAIDADDYIKAAKYSNECRKNGIQGSPVDYLICAVSVRCGYRIFTLDEDFKNYSKVIPIRLYENIAN